MTERDPYLDLDVVPLTCPLSTWAGDLGRCRWCNALLTGRQQRWCSPDHAREWVRNHCWTDARRAAVERDGACLRCGSVLSLEVNHRDPRNGEGYGPGCHHHQGNLETLCHTHHVEVTNEQRLARESA